MKAVQTIKKILHVQLTILVLLLLPCIVFTLVTSQTSFLPIRSFTVLTGSMEPTLPVGSMVYVRNTNNYWKGDVITFQQGDVLVTHRIIDVINKNNSLFYTTKGDANSTSDTELIAAKDIVGEQIFAIPHIGNLAGILKTTPGFVGLIVVPTLLFIGFELWKIKQEIVKETEKRILEKMQGKKTQRLFTY